MKALPFLLALTACGPMPPTTVPAVRAGTAVHASFGRTWNAVIDQFADRNIPIRTIDRSSGLIATDVLHVGDADSVTRTWADCGTAVMNVSIAPDFATYNVVVRGDSLQSTVKVTVRWASSSNDCVTLGAWEHDFEEAVKTKAERP